MSENFSYTYICEINRAVLDQSEIFFNMMVFKDNSICMWYFDKVLTYIKHIHRAAWIANELNVQISEALFNFIQDLTQDLKFLKRDLEFRKLAWESLHLPNFPDIF